MSFCTKALMRQCPRAATRPLTLNTSKIVTAHNRNITSKATMPPGSDARIKTSHNRPLHTTMSQAATPATEVPINDAPPPPDPKENPTVGISPHPNANIGQQRLADFNLSGRVFLVTGGAQGLGLSLAEGLAEAGGHVYCFDRATAPDARWYEAKRRAGEWGGSLHYRQVDVQDDAGLDKTISGIADKHQRLDGVIAAAGVQKLSPAVEYQREDVSKMMDINYAGVMMTCTAAARQMFKYKCHGSMCLIASMSGSVANKGLLSPVYNSSKAAVIQLARNLAMEWSPIRKDGTGGIRVNCISPGHILTPMVLKNFEEVPGLKEKWEAENMMGRLADVSEFKGAALFLLSNASSFMTGNNLIIDGGHTSW